MNTSQSIEPLAYVLQNILKRYKALFFGKLILDEQSEEEDTLPIRHYDIECESIQSIVCILRTILQRRKIEAMLSIKNYGTRRFQRTNRKRSYSLIESQLKKYQGNTETTAFSRRSSCSKKIETSRTNQLLSIFQEVKGIANGSLRNKNPDNNQRRKSKRDEGVLKIKFLKGIEDINPQFSSNIRTERKSKRDVQLHASQVRNLYQQRGRRIQLIDINFD